MEIAIWTTVLTTIITLIQTWAMWYFTQRVKLQDSEMEELVDEINGDDTVEPVSPVQLEYALKTVDAQIGDEVERLEARNEAFEDWVSKCLEALNQNTLSIEALSDDILDVLDDLSGSVQVLGSQLGNHADRLDQLESDPAEPSDPEEPREPVFAVERIVLTDVEDLSVEDEEEIVLTEESKVLAAQALEDSGVNTNRGNARRVGIREAARRAVEEAKVREDTQGQADNVERAENAPQAPIKESRDDEDPMITDLRAEPFAVEGETLDGTYDLPTFGDGYEAWGASTGNAGGVRQPRQRGFRRI